MINGKNFYDKPNDSDIKRYEEINNRGKVKIILLDYGYIKNHYRLIAVDLSRQIELDADPKEILQIEFAGQSKNVDGINADGTQSMFILTVLEKIKEPR